MKLHIRFQNTYVKIVKGKYENYNMWQMGEKAYSTAGLQHSLANQFLLKSNFKKAV